jgi:uncharacterized protein (DUF697 family)
MTPLIISIKRKKAAGKIIRRRMLYAAGLGLIPIPVVDVASIFSTQVLMVREIANLYNIPFNKHRVESFIGVLVGDLGTISIVKAIPGLGTLLGGATLALSGAAATYAIGKIFTQHFNQGGTLLDFDPVQSREYFYKLYEEEEFKEKERNALRAKRRRKALRRKRLKWLVFTLLFIGIIASFFYFNNDSRDFTMTEAFLIKEETSAIKINFQPVENLDSITSAAISSFDPNSTEGVINRYIQDEASTYPKIFALSAVRFTGSAVAIGNTGAKKQLSNIGFLMKKYPDLIVNLYGQTANTWSKVNRQRIGRERARFLKRLLESQGIAGSRITDNYIEKPLGTHYEYWGADIVINVSSWENNADVNK